MTRINTNIGALNALKSLNDQANISPQTIMNLFK
jgi:hypothetical protein